jgi:hypothetical protein
MGLEKTFRQFTTTLLRLHDRMGELRLTAVVDRPEKNDAVVVDTVEYAVEDVLGWLNEAVHAAKAAGDAAGKRTDIDQARRALANCQERFRRIEQVFTETLLSYDRMKDLASFGSERRGEWPSWVTTVRHGIDECRHPLEEARNALADCWEEIAERVGTTSISVQATTIGQQISRRAGEPDVERESVA